MNENRLHLKPLLLTAAIVLLDQITKFIIVKTIPYRSIGRSFFGDFFRIIHVRNLGAAFSLGDGASPPLRIAVMIVLPAAVIIAVIVFLTRSDEVSNYQRWLLAGIAGGGIGNVFFDRIFRPLGVVDFLDVKFYGLFGLERWPTFNIADSATVVCGILLMISLLVEGRKQSNKQEAGDNGR